MRCAVVSCFSPLALPLPRAYLQSHTTKNCPCEKKSKKEKKKLRKNCSTGWSLDDTAMSDLAEPNNRTNNLLVLAQAAQAAQVPINLHS